MRRLMVVLLSLSIWIGSGCARTNDATADAPSDGTAAAEPAAPEPVAPNAQSHKGVLAYTPTDTKSVDAYLGTELTLVAGADRVVLAPSDKVSRDVLIAAAGETVTITCIPREPVAPHPEESYPMEADGSPMKRPVRCEVIALVR